MFRYQFTGADVLQKLQYPCHVSVRTKECSSTVNKYMTLTIRFGCEFFSLHLMSVFIPDKDTAKVYVHQNDVKSKYQSKNELISIRDFEAVHKKLVVVY